MTVKPTEAMIEAALHARVPGGSEVWAWLPQQDAWTPHEIARDVLRAALTAALAVQDTEPVRVKPLEWTAHPYLARYEARSAIGLYLIEQTTREVYLNGPRDDEDANQKSFVSVEEAKAAAQSDYEARIRSAIEPQPEPVDLPQDVINLVIAAREAFDAGTLPDEESRALDKALDPFSARVGYENEPEGEKP